MAKRWFDTSGKVILSIAWVLAVTDLPQWIDTRLPIDFDGGIAYVPLAAGHGPVATKSGTERRLDRRSG